MPQEHGRNEQDLNNESQAYAACGSLGEEFMTERGMGDEVGGFGTSKTRTGKEG